MRKSRKNKAAYLLAMLLIPAFFASAQKTFRYRALLEKVDSAGFYKINLGPDFLANSNPGFSDIRILGPSNNFIPYINSEDFLQPDKKTFVVLPQITVKSNTDTGTTFVVETKQKDPVTTLWVKLKNTEVKRTVNISGSDDLDHWFAIKEDILLQGAGLNNDGSYMQSLTFPASSYRYLRLLVNDKNKTPVKFLEAGIFQSYRGSITYWPIPFKISSQKESDKTTSLTISLNANYQVNLLHLTISQPKYYQRSISVYQVDKQSNRLIYEAEVTPADHGDVFINTRARKLKVQIQNGDNAPLVISNVKVSQADHYIVSYLEPKKSYWLLTGDTTAKMPAYDLKFFADSIRNLQAIHYGVVDKNPAYQNIVVASTKNGYSGVIWAAIIAALLLLSLLTWKMIGEVNKKAIK